VVLIESSTSPMDHCDRQRIPSLVTVEKPILDISGRADNTAARTGRTNCRAIFFHTTLARNFDEHARHGSSSTYLARRPERR
jgi:hypothetical protein